MPSPGPWADTTVGGDTGGDALPNLQVDTRKQRCSVAHQVSFLMGGQSAAIEQEGVLGKAPIFAKQGPN